MALPKLTIAKYPITIPSTGKQTFFRPFLIKEQKVLLMAAEGGDEKQIVNAMLDIVTQCVDGLEDVKAMPIFDMEYLFLNIRAKSAGEIVTLTTRCPKCSKNLPVEMKLEEIRVQFPENSNNRIMLTESMGMIMRYPNMGDSVVDMASLGADSVVEFVSTFVETVFDEDNTYSSKDFTHKEIVTFMESLTTEQFEKITDFFRKMPALRKEMDLVCTGCGHGFKTQFSGLRDFFT